MPRRQLQIAACLVLLSLLAFLSDPFRIHPGTPSARNWIRQLGSAEPARQSEAMSALAGLHGSAVPALRKTLLYHPHWMYRKLVQMGRQIPGFRFDLPEPSRMRAHSAVVLGRIGPAAHSAVPELILTLHDAQAFVSARAQSALVQIGPVAVPQLIQALDHPSTEARQHLIRTLGEIGSEARAAAPALARCLLDPDPSLRGQAAEALGSILCDTTVPALGVSLSDPDGTVRRQAAAALSKFGARAAPATPGLIGALADPEATVRIHAANALGRIGPPAHAAVAPLTRNLSHEASVVRVSAAVALGRMGPAAATAAPELTSALSSSDLQTRINAAQALGRIGPAARVAVLPLAQSLSDEPHAYRVCAIEALGFIGAEASVAIPALLEVLGNHQSGLGRFVRTALARIRPDLYDPPVESASE